MDILKQVALNVASVRRGRGWSQEELAFESGLHRTYISGIERGARNSTILVIDQLATALRVRPATHLPINPER